MHISNLHVSTIMLTPLIIQWLHFFMPASSGSLTSETFDHPLSEPSVDMENHVESHLSPVRSYNSELNHSASKGKLGDRKQGGHGICLTTSDQDRIKIFMHELCVRALIPWAERQMKILNEQVLTLMKKSCNIVILNNTEAKKTLPWLVTISLFPSTNSLLLHEISACLQERNKQVSI